MQSVGNQIKNAFVSRTHTFNLRKHLTAQPTDATLTQNKWKSMDESDIPIDERLYLIYWHDTTNGIPTGSNPPKLTSTWRFAATML